jgi:hypothetical protein
VTFAITTGTSVTKLSFASSTMVVDSGADSTPVVSATDVNGDVVAAAPVELTVRNTAVASVSGGVVSGLRAGQTFLVATSPDNPAATDSTLLVVANVGGPVVFATLPRFDLKADTTFMVSVMVDIQRSGETLGAATVQVAWNPDVLTYIDDADGASGVGATVNSMDAAAGSFTLSMASASGIDGIVELRRLTFRAAALAPRIGTLQLNVQDLNGAMTFTDLLPVTVAASYPLRIR